MDCVIVGGGVAGLKAGLTIRQQSPEKSVILVDTEKEIGYYRTLLPQFMNQTLPEKKLFFWSIKDDSQLKVISGVRVDSVDRRNRCLYLDNRQTVNYQRLLIATGGRPIVPAVCEQAFCSGIYPVRSLATARAARDWLPEHPEIVILGGGLVGVKMAAHLAGFNFSVTLIEREEHLLPQALSAEAAQIVEAHLESNNIRLLLGSTVEDIGTADKTIRAVQVDKKWIPCQTLFIAVGSIPDLNLFKDSALLQDGQLVVTPTLQTKDTHIFGAGDAVTIVRNGNFTPWTWPQAVVQGQLAARNLLASASVSLDSLSRVNCMNLNGLSLAILGSPIPGAQRRQYSRPDSNVYRELFHRDGKIVGGALIGDISNGGSLHTLMNIGGSSEADLDEVLRPCLEIFSTGSSSCTKFRRRATLTLSGGVY